MIDAKQGACMQVAVQQLHGAIVAFPMIGQDLLKAVVLPIAPPAGRLEPANSSLPGMPAAKPREFLIQGVTLAGKTFRPSDWPERLAGALSSFRPRRGAAGNAIGAHIGYSPYCVPQVIEGIKCVIVNEALRDLAPMAWDFVMHFARDNALQVVEACLLPEPLVSDSPLRVDAALPAP